MASFQLYYRTLHFLLKKYKVVQQIKSKRTITKNKLDIWATIVGNSTLFIKIKAI